MISNQFYFLQKYDVKFQVSRLAESAQSCCNFSGNLLKICMFIRAYFPTTSIVIKLNLESDM